MPVGIYQAQVVFLCVKPTCPLKNVTKKKFQILDFKCYTPRAHDLEGLIHNITETDA